jgi:small GTP-binding protein
MRFIPIHILSLSRGNYFPFLVQPLGSSDRLAVPRMMNHSESLKVVFLGESGTGKTSIITRYIDRTFSGTPTPTVGCSGHTIEYPYRDRFLNLVIWDTAGQELYRSLTPVYYRNATAAVIVFDVSVRETFDQVQNWIANVRDVVDNIALIVCGNKIDLADQRAVDGLDGAALAEHARAAYVETSATKRMGLEQLFETIVREAVGKQPDIFCRTDQDLMDNNAQHGCC